MRADADAAQVETVCVPAREYRNVANDQAITMPLTRADQKVKIGRLELEHGGRERLRELGRPRPMTRIVTIVQTPRIV